MSKENSVFQSLEMIERRISEKLTVENIASSVYFSKYHYQRLFREIVGDSVMEYVTKRRLTLAGRALLETDASIIDIALDYGYDSREGFARSFKAYMGVSPTEYRKYSLAAISQNIAKERLNMTYSKAIDEIIRELNEFVAKAKETAGGSRKQTELPEYVPFWKMLADAVDGLADNTKEVLDHISMIAEHPDEIAKRFLIIKVIEDIGFQSNLLAFNIGLMISRDTPERTSKQWPLYEKHLELARSASMKAEKIAGFFNELSSLIFNDMRKTAAVKMSDAIETGKAAADGINGYSYYSYIKEEIVNLINKLSIPIEEIGESLLDDCLFELSIIMFAADMDIFRMPSHKALFDGLKAFKDSLFDAAEFFKTLAKPEQNAILERTMSKRLQDIAYHGNILLFYTRGEIDKLGHLADDEQKAAFSAICEKINSFIQHANSAADEAAFKPVANQLNAIYADMIAEADKLDMRGGAVRFLANEFKALGDAVMQRAIG